MRLQLTRRADYAIRAMILLGRADDELITGREIARQMSIPERLVTQVMGQLVRAGLVGARLGRNGGYRLETSAAQIPILTIVRAVEGENRRQRCIVRGLPCVPGEVCEVHEIFSGAHAALIDRLAAATLATALAHK